MFVVSGKQNRTNSAPYAAGMETPLTDVRFAADLNEKNTGRRQWPYSYLKAK